MTGHSRLTHQVTAFFHKLSETARRRKRISKKARSLPVVEQRVQETATDIVLDTVSEEDSELPEEELPSTTQREWLSLSEELRASRLPPLNGKLADIVLKRALGKGGYATVYLAEKPDGSRSALKVVKKSRLALKQAGAEEMKNEKDILEFMTLASRNLDMFTRLSGAFQDDHSYYFAMEYCPGGSLADVLENCGGSFSERRTQFITAQLVHAISYMHALGILHRDLKLDNCLISENGYLRIADFGLAVDLSQGELPNVPCGTPGYMAPEVYMREQYSEPADLWSLGCMVYEMLFGQVPFDHKDVGEIERSTILKPVVFPASISSSSQARNLISSLLSKSPDRRMKVSQILRHPFFGSDSYIKGDWDSVKNQTLAPQPHWIPNEIPISSSTALSKMILIDHDLVYSDWSPSAAERAFETTGSWEMVERNPRASRKLPGATGQNVVMFDLSALPTSRQDVEDNGDWTHRTMPTEASESRDGAISPQNSWDGLFDDESIHLVDTFEPIYLPDALSAQDAVVNQWNPPALISPIRGPRFGFRNESPASSEFTLLNPSAYPSSAAITLVPSLPGSSRDVQQYMAPVVQPSKCLRRMKAFGDRSRSYEQTASSSFHS